MEEEKVMEHREQMSKTQDNRILTENLESKLEQISHLQNYSNLKPKQFQNIKKNLDRIESHLNNYEFHQGR